MVALRVVATVLVYNEADIVGQVLDHLHEHGVSFVVLDGGSEDGSIEIAQAFTGKGLLEHKVVRRSVWKYREDLDCLIQMAARHSPDWVVYNDADEFLEPREPGRTLYEAIARENQLGFNIIQFDQFRFLSNRKRLPEQQNLTSEKDSVSTLGAMTTGTRHGNIAQGRHFATAEDTIRFSPAGSNPK